MKFKLNFIVSVVNDLIFDKEIFFSKSIVHSITTQFLYKLLIWSVFLFNLEVKNLGLFSLTAGSISVVS